MSPAEDLLRRLGELAADLGPALRPPGHDAALSALTETVRRVFGAAACSLALLTDDESELVYTAAAGEGSEQVVGMRIPSSAGLAGWVVQSGQPIAVSDLAQDQRFDRDTAARTGYVPQAMIVVPLASERRTFGVLSLLDRDTTRTDAPQDMTLLCRFADQATAMLESAEGFGDLGRVLLAAVADAGAGDGDLDAGLGRVRSTLRGRDADLAALAGVFSVLAQQGVAERRLALGVLTQVADFAGRRSPRRA